MKAKLNSPIPTRYAEDESSFISKAAQQTGLPASEIVRRSVRLMRQHLQTHPSQAGSI
jgi:hypothetical protein